MQPVIFSVAGGNATNGTATVDGGATASVASSGNVTLKLRGGTQTAPGHAGNLRLIASFAGAQVGASSGFSVSSIPQNWNMSFHSLITGARLGFVVQDRWESDSGQVADLDEAEISEEVQYDAGTGVFAGVGANNSGYLPADSFTQDSHSTPRALLTGPGSIVAHQTAKFKDDRSGSNDIPMKDSGYKIVRLATNFPGGDLFLGTAKEGATTTANGIRSDAGSGSVTRIQRV